MKSAGIFKGMVMCLAALGVCLSGAVSAAPPAPEPVVHDVALAAGGVFQGQLLDAQGAAKVGDQVTLLLDQRPIAKAETSAQGQFAFQGVRGGVYQLAAAGEVETYRLWAPGTEPKGVGRMAMMVADRSVVRGQYYNNGQAYYYQHSHSYLGHAKYLLSNPWVVSGIVATAVAVPVGINNAQGGDAPASP
jgi:hypothetical protein